MILDLVPDTHEILHTPTELFDFKNPPIDPTELVNNMFETMVEYRGIGLAAPQCGLPYRVFVMDADPAICIFNPVITFKSEENTTMAEGCLTFPGIGVSLERSETIRARFADHNGTIHGKTLKGLSARCFLHELDHLNGITFLDSLSPFKRKYYIGKLRKFKGKISK